jgi:hypothetical protein
LRPASASRVAAALPIPRAALEPRDARVDIAAPVDDAQVGSQRQQLRLAPQRRGADHRALLQIGDRARSRSGTRTGGRDEHVARVLALGHAVDRQPVGEPRLHVLERVDGDVDLAVAQRLLDLLGEQALAAGLGQRPVLDAIPRGADRHDGDGVGRRQLGHAAARRRRTHSLCASASGEPRVPIRIKASVIRLWDARFRRFCAGSAARRSGDRDS